MEEKMTRLIKVSGFTQAGMWAANHLSAGLSRKPSRISFSRLCFSTFGIFYTFA
jgi:hypothetical protein